jgi:hypothetical protein
MAIEKDAAVQDIDAQSLPPTRNESRDGVGAMVTYSHGITKCTEDLRSV